MPRPSLPPLDRGPLPRLLGYALRRAQSAVFADFAASVRLGGRSASPGELGLLVLVRHNPGISQAALARGLGIDRSTLQPILDRLQARALLRRDPVPEDARRHALALTAAGSRALAAALVQVRRHEARLAAPLDRAEAATLHALLDKVRAGLRSAQRA